MDHSARSRFGGQRVKARFCVQRRKRKIEGDGSDGSHGRGRVAARILSPVKWSMVGDRAS